MVLVPVLMVGAARVTDPVKRLELENSIRSVVVPGLAGALFLLIADLTWRQVEAATCGRSGRSYATAGALHDQILTAS